MGEVEEMLSFLRKKISEFRAAERLEFKDYINQETWRAIQSPTLDQPGVYIIYEGEKVIYIGSTVREGRIVRYRIGDLFYGPNKPGGRFKHSLTNTLFKNARFESVEEIREHYLHRCSFKVVGTPSSRHAKLLEAALIFLLQPEYNRR